MSFEKVLTPDEILRQGGIDPSLLGLSPASPASTTHAHPEAPVSVKLPNFNTVAKEKAGIDVNNLSDSDLESLINNAKEALLLRTYKNINVRLLESVDKVAKGNPVGQKIMVIQAHEAEGKTQLMFNVLDLNLNSSSQSAAVYSQANSNVNIIFTADKGAVDFFRNPQQAIETIVSEYINKSEEESEHTPTITPEIVGEMELETNA